MKRQFEFGFVLNILCHKRKIQFGYHKDVHKVPLYEFIAISGMVHTSLSFDNVPNNKIIAEAKQNTRENVLYLIESGTRRRRPGKFSYFTICVSSTTIFVIHSIGLWCTGSVTFIAIRRFRRQNRLYISKGHLV